MADKIEKRSSADGIEYRADEEAATRMIVGYAAVFNRETDLGWIREMISPEAFQSTDMTEARGLFNHDASLLLGRASSGTLRLSVDNVGLKYEIDLPNTTVGKDVEELARRGDITQSSFAFTVESATWEDIESEKPRRVINKIAKLFDVSPVTYPAYGDTTASLRGLEQARAEKIDHQAYRARAINITEME